MDNQDRIDLSNCDRFSAEYLIEIEKFLDYAFREGDENGKVRCPCKKCVLRKLKIRGDIYDDLVVNGIMSGYNTWFCHGESLSNQSSSPHNSNVQRDIHNSNMTQLVHDALGVFEQTVEMNVDEDDGEDTNTYNDYVD